VHQILDLASWENYRSAAAQAAVAKAKAEVAARGLVVTVVQNYFAAAAAEKKLDSAARTADAGENPASHPGPRKGRGSRSFRRNQSGSASQERRRQLQEAKLELLNARLDPRRPALPGFQRPFRNWR